MIRKRVLVTGAASGIGAATTAALRHRGCEVLGLDLDGDGASVLTCDVRDQAQVNAAVAEAVERLSGLDVLINCAGLATPQSAGLPPDARAEAVVDVNLLGPWRVTGAALPALRAARGRVVNTASGMAYVALPFAPAYAMSKHGVMAYSQALRLEHGDAIHVVTVYPGFIRTPIHRDSLEFGMSVAGTSPEERMEDAVAAFTRAALAPRPPRNITTTPSGRLNNALCRFGPRWFVEGEILRRMRKKLVGRAFPDTDHPVAVFGRRLEHR